MKKKMIVAGCIVVAVIAIITVVSFCIPKKEVALEQSIETREQKEAGRMSLVGLADSKEEAQEIAEAYQIDLISFDTGVAVFETDKKYSEIQALEEEKGLVPLSINNEVSIFE